MAKKKISIRIDENVYNSIVTYADNTNASITSVIEDACKEHVSPDTTLRGYLIKALNCYNREFPESKIMSKVKASV